MTDARSYFASHLDELRQRLIISFGAILCATAVAYFFAEQITGFFMVPLRAAGPHLVKLIYTNLTEAFVTYLKLSLLVGIIASFPILLYEVWMFVAPGLMRREKRQTLTVIFWGSGLFIAGVCFAYFVVLPEALAFFMGFTTPRLHALPKLGSYLTFVARTGLAFGLAFEIPFLMVAALRMKLVKPDYFRTTRLYYYPAILVLAVLLTAGELFSAVLLAGPLISLFEAGILAGRIFAKLAPKTPEDIGEDSLP